MNGFLLAAASPDWLAPLLASALVGGGAFVLFWWVFRALATASGGVARVMATLEKERPDFLLNEKVRPQNLSM